ncbi:hypothetical protein D3C85_834710 [compost metagenome]
MVIPGVLAELLGIHVSVRTGITVVWLNDMNSHAQPLHVAHYDGQAQGIVVVDQRVPMSPDIRLALQAIGPFCI